MAVLSGPVSEYELLLRTLMVECPDSPNDVFYKRRNVVKYANYKIADYLMKKCCMD